MKLNPQIKLIKLAFGNFSIKNCVFFCQILELAINEQS